MGEMTHLDVDAPDGWAVVDVDPDIRLERDDDDSWIAISSGEFQTFIHGGYQVEDSINGYEADVVMSRQTVETQAEAENSVEGMMGLLDENSVTGLVSVETQIGRDFLTLTAESGIDPESLSESTVEDLLETLYSDDTPSLTSSLAFVDESETSGLLELEMFAVTEPGVTSLND
jgi:hypothetical protein